MYIDLWKTQLFIDVTFSVQVRILHASPYT